jgi:transcriptional regulator with XRE-family HTH domain
LVALGKTIKEVRLSKGISQERLALLAEVDRSYVGRIERGDNNAAVLTLSRLAEALDISVAKLMQKAGL